MQGYCLAFALIPVNPVQTHFYILVLQVKILFVKRMREDREVVVAVLRQRIAVVCPMHRPR